MTQSVTSLKVTSEFKDSIQLWTACDVHQALMITRNRGANLTDFAVFPNRAARAEPTYQFFYEIEKDIARLTTITRLSLSVYQVDLQALTLFSSMRLHSLHVQGFGTRPLNWSNLSECVGPFAELTELRVHNFFPADVLALLGCHALVSGLLSVSMSFACMTGFEARVPDCTQLLAEFSQTLESVAIEFHSHYKSTAYWCSRLAGLPLRHLSLRGCTIWTDLGALCGLWPGLRSLCLPDQPITISQFEAFANCPDLRHLVLSSITPGPPPDLLPYFDQDLVVHGTFRLRTMTREELTNFAR